MHTLIFPLIVIILTVQSSHCNVNSTTNLDGVFSIINKRLDLALSVGAFKLQNCKPIENLERQKDVLNKTAQANLTLDEIQTYFRGQIEANILLQYDGVVLDRSKLPKPEPTIDNIRAQIDTLDRNVIPLLKPALDELKSLQNVSDCLDHLDAVNKQNCPPGKTEAFKLAMLRAANLFIESCLKTPFCKAN